jgi:hypothetical protein
MNRLPFPSRLFSSSLILAVAILTATACSRSLDMAVVDRAISDGINTQLQLPIATVSCPAGDRPVKEGDAFDCIATPKIGGQLTVTVTQQPDAGKVSWTVTRTEGLLDLDKVEASVKDGLKGQLNVDATVACEGRWKAVKVGEAFQCQATSGDHKATIEVTTLDQQGRISWKVQ